ncbi:hypothetical protein DVW08_08710 [Clostridium botulinum]|nr:hypothetical protein [Clostridium botulinum]
MKRKRVRLNVKFNGDKICCAKSPELCGKCKEHNKCELLDMYYYPYDGMIECMRQIVTRENVEHLNKEDNL